MTRVEIAPKLWLDARRAVYFEELGTLVVADVHWGYSTSHRAAGNLLPMWGDEEIAHTLRSVISDYAPREMIWLGDSLHALSGRQPAEEFLATCQVPVILLPGNHDRKWPVAQEVSLRRGPYFFHHGDLEHKVPEEAIEVVGHHHPAFSWYDGAGTRLKLSALVQGARRLILPAFSPWAAGSPWNHLLTEDEKLWVLSPQRIFAITLAGVRRARSPERA